MSARRAALLSLLPHGDRTYLDDRDLALLSGALREAGIGNDLVSAVLRAEDDVAELAGQLEPYAFVVYERIWSTEIIEALRARLPGATFVACRGEHEIADPPADYWCRGSLHEEVPRLLARLLGERAPPGEPGAPEPPREAARAFSPNLAPVVLDAGARSARRSFSILGNAGCPYQADARANPLYAGVELPEGMGRGCAFCTTGNHYEHSPASETAARVLAQIRHVRATAPRALDLVLKDQNPFGYLVALLEGIRREEPPGGAALRLLLETRADWFVKNRARFDEALLVAASCGVTLAPYLVGIESFSQAELDRFNKGIAAADNEAFLFALWEWKAAHPDVLDLSAAAFGFVLFSPWTTLEDLAVSHAAIVRTGLSRLRGKLLTSWARLYPDTALYHLAKRDGLLTDAWPAGDPSGRHGYHPSQPWRFRDPAVEAIARAALELTEETAGRDQVGLFGALLEHGGDVDAVRGALERPDPMRARLARWVRPLDLDALPGELRLSHLAHADGALTLTFDGEDVAPLQLVVRPTGAGRYSVEALRPPTHPRARRALDALVEAFSAGAGAPRQKGA